MKKLLRILGILTGLALVVGYLGFSTYFFSPFEGGFEADVAGLVPRRVHFFAAKDHLERDFDSFPRLAAAEEFALDETWASVLQSPEYMGLIESLGIEEALEQVQEETQGDVDREALLAATDERLKRVRGVGHVIKTSRAQLAKWATEAGFQQAVGQNKE